MIWRTPSGKRVRVSSQRMVSLVHRHLAVMTLEVTLLDSAGPDRGLLAAAQPPGRRGRVPRAGPPPSARARTRRQARKFDHRVLQPQSQRERRQRDRPRLPMREQRDDAGMRNPPPHRDVVRHRRSTTDVGADLAKTVFTVRATPGDPIKITKLVAYHSSNGVPAQELADRCTRTLARAESEGTDQLLSRATRVARRVLVERRHRTPRRRPRPAGPALEPVPARPGVGAHAGAGHRREGRHRRRLRRPLLLGHRGLRGAVPRLHDARGGPEGHPLPMEDARRRPPTRRRDEPGRSAVPVAHDQRRGGLRLLRGRHRAVPHQRSGGARAAPLSRGVRRHRLPVARGRRDPRRDRTPVGRSRLLLEQRIGARSTSTGSPDPTSTRRSSTTTSTRT